MWLPLRDGSKTAGAGVVFDGPPGWYLPHMPTAVEGFFVRVVGVKGDSRVVHRYRGAMFSAAFGVLIPSAPIFPGHATIVTYSPVSHSGLRNLKHPLDWWPLCDLSLPNVLSPTLAA